MLKGLEKFKREGTMDKQRDCGDCFQIFEEQTYGMCFPWPEWLQEAPLAAQGAFKKETGRCRTNGEALLTLGVANAEVACPGMC